MRGHVYILDSSGHTALEWDSETTNRKPEDGPLDQAYVEEQFERMIKRGYFAVGEKDGKKEMLRHFNSTFPSVVMSPILSGG